jgi:hypothetical protein
VRYLAGTVSPVVLCGVPVRQTAMLGDVPRAATVRADLKKTPRPRYWQSLGKSLKVFENVFTFESCRILCAAAAPACGKSRCQVQLTL